MQNYGTISAGQHQHDSSTGNNANLEPNSFRRCSQCFCHAENHRDHNHVHRCLCMRRSTFLLSWLFFFYISWLALGACIFMLLETPAEVRVYDAVSDMRNDFLGNYSCIIESDLERLIAKVVEANNRGVSASKNISSEPNWSFGQSFFFAATVVTTIGYGHVTPLSEAGKTFCVLFAVIGIPLTLIILSAFVEKLMVPSTLALQWLNSRLGHLYQPFNIRLIHLVGCGTLVVVATVLVPAAIFWNLEADWSYLDSIYYCFISLTTVGLGDYIPGDHPEQVNRPLYKIMTTVYLLLGLVMMMWLLSVFAEVPQLNFGIIFMHHSDEQCSDPEKMRLSGSPAPGPKYNTQNESHVKVINRPMEETPSPEETTPVHARQ